MGVQLVAARDQAGRIMRGQPAILRGRDAPIEGRVYATYHGALIAVGDVERGPEHGLLLVVGGMVRLVGARQVRPHAGDLDPPCGLRSSGGGDELGALGGRGVERGGYQRN